MPSLSEKIYLRLLEGRRRRFGAAPARIAACKIISVGNVTTGGTGKTPAVGHIARHLQGRGARVAVVARGYGGSLSARGAVVSDGKSVFLNARQAGDEPLLHARALPGVPVVIGRDRVTACRRAQRELGAQVIVLDDGFQFWSLHRDLDLVLLDARRPWGSGRLLPHGRLREPPSALRRAGAVLLTRADRATSRQLAKTRAEVRRWTQAPLFESRHAPAALRDENAQTAVELPMLRGARVAALSGLADNASFTATLRGLNAQVVMHAARRDHHFWRAREVRHIERRGRELNASALVTSAKDAVKIAPSWCGSLPLWSLQIELQITSDEAPWRALLDDVLQA